MADEWWRGEDLLGGLGASHNAHSGDAKAPGWDLGRAVPRTHICLVFGSALEST